LVFCTYGTYCTVGFSHPKQGYHSPGTKKTYVECTKYIHRHTPAKAFSFWREIVFCVSYIWYLLYSGLHPKQGYRSPGTKKTYVECTKYVHRHNPAKASSCQPQTTNKRTMAEASGFRYHDISFGSWPNHMFEMMKSIGSICSGHPLM
jgi:hypothetical protein